MLRAHSSWQDWLLAAVGDTGGKQLRVPWLGRQELTGIEAPSQGTGGCSFCSASPTQTWMRFALSPLCSTSTVGAAAQAWVSEVLLDGAVLSQCPVVNQPLLAACSAMPVLPTESSGDGLVLANAFIGKNVFATNVLFQNALCPAGSLG